MLKPLPLAVCCWALTRGIEDAIKTKQVTAANNRLIICIFPLAIVGCCRAKYTRAKPRLNSANLEVNHRHIGNGSAINTDVLTTVDVGQIGHCHAVIIRWQRRAGNGVAAIKYEFVSQVVVSGGRGSTVARWVLAAGRVGISPQIDAKLAVTGKAGSRRT